MTEPAREPVQAAAYWSLIRDVAVLQLKLIADGFRDLVLLPAALIAGLVSLLRSENGRPGPQFYRLLVSGKRTEHWINLFGALDNAPPEALADVPADEPDIDTIVARLENFVVDEYRRGGVTAQARDHIDNALRAIRRRRGRGGCDEPPAGA
jgi:hypothetical protein